MPLFIVSHLGDWALYRSFDTLDDLTTYKRTVRVNFDPRIPGQVLSHLKHYIAQVCEPRSLHGEFSAVPMHRSLYSHCKSTLNQSVLSNQKCIILSSFIFWAFFETTDLLLLNS